MDLQKEFEAIKAAMYIDEATAKGNATFGRKLSLVPKGYRRVGQVKFATGRFSVDSRHAVPGTLRGMGN